MNIDTLSEDIYSRMKRDPTVAFDPMTLILITKSIIDIIQVIKKCRKSSEEVVYRAQHPQIREKLIVQRTVRRKLGVLQYFKIGRPMIQAILSQGRNMNSTDITQLL